MNTHSNCNNGDSSTQKSFFFGICLALVTSISAISFLHGEDSGLTIKDYLYEQTPSYGNYCGPLMTYGGSDSLLCPLPVDDIDVACAAHDYLYSHTVETDYYSRALADLKLTGAFLTSPATSLKSLSYSTAGSIAMPIQAAMWTIDGIAREGKQWIHAKQPARNINAEDDYIGKLPDYYSEIIYSDSDKYLKLMREYLESENKKRKVQMKYWEEYYRRAIRDGYEQGSNLYNKK